MIAEKLIIDCKKNQRQAQKEVYDLLSPRLYLTCKRYLKKEDEIEDALSESFYIIFSKINQLKENGAFEGWAKRIAVNHCLLQIKKKVNFNMYLDDVKTISQPLSPEMTDLETEDLMNLLNFIPKGCRTIFTLFAIEGYNHKEIAEQLQISEGTSKSQLNVAKTKLKDLVNNLYYQKAT